MNEHDDVMYQVRESFSGLRMEMPVESVFARGRARQRRRLSGLTATAAATAGVAAAVTLTLGGTTPARSGHQPPASPHVKLAVFSVASGPGGTTTLVLRKGPQYQLDPTALRQALARRGIPALVTVGSFCRSTPAPAGIGQILSQDASGALQINGRALPPGTRLSIGYFPNAVRLGLVKDGAHLSCGAASGQPVVHLPPTGAPIRGHT